MTDVEELTRLSSELSSIVEALAPSVVRIEARRRLPASGLVWSADGLVLAASHAIELDEHIRLGLGDGRTVPAALVGRDPATDIALVRAEAGDLTPAPWADPHGARVGHVVLSLGRPGRTVRARLGLLSAAADGWRTAGGAQIERYLEIDADPAPGFSGGPVADASGRVIGMATSSLVRRAVLAVPVPTVRRITDALLAHGRIRRGYLGIGAQPVRLPAALCHEVGQEAGLLLISVEPGSPAEQAGLMLGDTLVSLGPAPVHHLRDVLGLLGAEQIGASLPVRVLRAGRMLEASVVVGERG